MKALALTLLIFALNAFGQTATPGVAAGPAVSRIDAVTGTMSGVGKQTMPSDAAARSTVLGGANAYPRAATNTTGGDAKLCAGIGRRLFTIVDYSLIDAGADSVTVTVNGSGTTRTASTHWSAATSNAITASNLAADLNSAVSGITATASGASVYLTPASTTCTLTISTNMDAGEGTATSGADGSVMLGGPVATIAGHIVAGNTAAPPTIANNACGSTAQGTIASGGTDQSFVVNVGTAAVVSCTITFGTAFAVAPKSCVIAPGTSASAAMVTNVYVDPAQLTTDHVVLNGSAMDSSKWHVRCQ